MSKIAIKLANRDCPLSCNVTVQSGRSKAKGTRHFFYDDRQRKENRGNARMTRHGTSSGEQKSNERVLFSMCTAHRGSETGPHLQKTPSLHAHLQYVSMRNRMLVIER